MMIRNIAPGVLFMLLTQTSWKYLTQISSSSAQLGLEHVKKVGKDLIGITQCKRCIFDLETFDTYRTLPTNNFKSRRLTVRVMLFISHFFASYLRF